MLYQFWIFVVMSVKLFTILFLRGTRHDSLSSKNTDFYLFMSHFHEHVKKQDTCDRYEQNTESQKETTNVKIQRFFVRFTIVNKLVIVMNNKYSAWIYNTNYSRMK